MKVEIQESGREFRYRLRRDDDDPDEGRRDSTDSSDPFLLVNDEYRMILPDKFRTIHPDLHAVAIWYAIRPVVASRLELPFAVSVDLAEWMQSRHGVCLERVDDRQPPRRPPQEAVPALIFSGGMDSMAASLLMPAGTHHLFLDRIVHRRPHERFDALVDQVRQREACREVQAAGAPVHITADDHEHLFVPYPRWHSDMAILPALYLADSLGLNTIDSGEVLDAKYFGGYHQGGVTGWRMRPPAGRIDPYGFLEQVGLQRADSIGGLSEVATTAVVGRSRYRDKSFSCYYPSDDAFCMRCDKCFKKLLLRHVVEDQEVPESLMEHFLGFPHLAAIFSRPYFDWHHQWYYIFQKMRCRHWFARELQRQAQKGPDLSCLEKWYPKATADMNPAYSDVVLANIGREVDTMSAGEVSRLESMEVPPLEAPPLVERPPVRSVAISIPAEIKSLFRLLKAKLPADPPPRWGPYRLDDVFLRPGDPAVCLWLSAAETTAPPPAGSALVVRLFRISQPDDVFLARLGNLGLFIESSGPVEEAMVQSLVRSLKKVFAQAKQDIDRL